MGASELNGRLRTHLSAARAQLGPGSPSGASLGSPLGLATPRTKPRSKSRRKPRARARAKEALAVSFMEEDPVLQAAPSAGLSPDPARPGYFSLVPPPGFVSDVVHDPEGEGLSGISTAKVPMAWFGCRVGSLAKMRLLGCCVYRVRCSAKRCHFWALGEVSAQIRHLAVFCVSGGMLGPFGVGFRCRGEWCAKRCHFMLV